MSYKQNIPAWTSSKQNHKSLQQRKNTLLITLNKTSCVQKWDQYSDQLTNAVAEPLVN